MVHPISFQEPKTIKNAKSGAKLNLLQGYSGRRLGLSRLRAVSDSSCSINLINTSVFFIYSQMAEKELQISQSADEEVTNLKTIIQDMPIDMRLFSLALRSLYADNAVGGDSKSVEDFRKLRDATRNDAMVYLKGVLPLSTNFVASISEYFEYYDALEFDMWCEMLSDILQETASYKQLAEALVKMHEDILVPLKKRQDEAKIILREFKDLQEEFEKKKKELEDSAYAKRGWAIAFAFVPYVNAIAIPLLAASAHSDMAGAIAKGAESEVQGAAALTVSEALMPALQRFIDGLHKAAGFFSIMESELKKFDGKAGKSLESPKKLYYVMMKKEAKEMKSSCQGFYAILPAVRTDFEAIPTEGTDQNYVDKWLQKQKKIITESVSVKKLAAAMLKAITGPADSFAVNMSQSLGETGLKDTE